MILKNTIKVCNMKKESHGSHPLIDEIKYSIKGSTLLHAIIDCGAILAGINLKQFSQSVLNILPVEDFGGVLFYDGTDSLDWVVLERSGRCLPKDISPIQEVDSFVIFDEPRCRGTDLKLRSNAVALLTLAPNL